VFTHASADELLLPSEELQGRDPGQRPSLIDRCMRIISIKRSTKNDDVGSCVLRRQHSLHAAPRREVTSFDAITLANRGLASFGRKASDIAFE
jgi:hypothetical protein